MSVHRFTSKLACLSFTTAATATLKSALARGGQDPWQLLAIWPVSVSCIHVAFWPSLSCCFVDMPFRTLECSQLCKLAYCSCTDGSRVSSAGCLRPVYSWHPCPTSPNTEPKHCVTPVDLTSDTKKRTFRSWPFCFVPKTERRRSGNIAGERFFARKKAVLGKKRKFIGPCKLLFLLLAEAQEWRWPARVSCLSARSSAQARPAASSARRLHPPRRPRPL